MREQCWVTVGNVGGTSYIDRLEVHVSGPGGTRIWTGPVREEMAELSAHNARRYYLDPRVVADGIGMAGTPNGFASTGLVRVVDHMRKGYDARMLDDMTERIVAPKRYRIECVNGGDEHTDPPPEFRVFRYDYRDVASR